MATEITEGAVGSSWMDRGWGCVLTMRFSAVRVTRIERHRRRELMYGRVSASVVVL